MQVFLVIVIHSANTGVDDPGLHQHSTRSEHASRDLPFEHYPDPCGGVGADGFRKNRAGHRMVGFIRLRF